VICVLSEVAWAGMENSDCVYECEVRVALHAGPHANEDAVDVYSRRRPRFKSALLLQEPPSARCLDLK